MEMGGYIVLASIFFWFYCQVNVVSQSLKSSKVNDAVAFYAPPIIIYLAFYLTYRVAKSMIVD